MAKWGTYPPDEQLRLKRAAAEEMYEALSKIQASHCYRLCDDGDRIKGWHEPECLKACAILAKARGEA